MKSRFILLALCLTFALASFAPVRAATDDVIPPVPENGTLKDYQDYIYKIQEMYGNEGQRLLVQAQMDGITPESKEFGKIINSMKEISKKYSEYIQKAVDKALLLKDISDSDFVRLAIDKIQAIQSSLLFDSDDVEEVNAVNAKLEAFAAQLRQMGKEDIANAIEWLIFQRKISGYVKTGNVEEFAKVAAEIDEKVEKAGKDITLELAQQALLILSDGANLPNYEVPEGRQDKYLKALSEASDPDVNTLGNQYKFDLFRTKVEGFFKSGNVKEFANVAAEVDKIIEKAGKDITPTMAQQALLITVVGDKLQGYKVPEERYDNYFKALLNASNPKVQQYAGMLERNIIYREGRKRFKELLGKELKFAGTFLDGSECKAEDYAGKVVLINFWTTAYYQGFYEVTNVKKIYDAYHDKGFEVIGVSCDNPASKNELINFLKDNGITWKQMFNENAVVPGMNYVDGEPILVSEYYGMGNIPYSILIGKDGKVISLNARGGELKEQLVKIFGKVEKASVDKDE